LLWHPVDFAVILGLNVVQSRRCRASYAAAGVRVPVPVEPPPLSLVVCVSAVRDLAAALAALPASAEPCAVEWSVAVENREMIALDDEDWILGSRSLSVSDSVE